MKYFRAIELLCELIGLHPRRAEEDCDLIEILRKHGWREFRVERYP